MSTPTPQQGQPDEISLDSPEDLDALAAEMASAPADEADDAPWADGPEALVGGDIPPPPGAGTSEEPDDGPDTMPRSVEGVGDLVADPLSRAKVIPRDDPGGPDGDEVPPSPS